MFSDFIVFKSLRRLSAIHLSISLSSPPHPRGIFPDVPLLYYIYQKTTLLSVGCVRSLLTILLYMFRMSPLSPAGSNTVFQHCITTWLCPTVSVCVAEWVTSRASGFHWSLIRGPGFNSRGGQCTWAGAVNQAVHPIGMPLILNLWFIPPESVNE